MRYFGGILVTVFVVMSTGVSLFALRPSDHWKITYSAARRAGLSERASRIAADGATAPDKFDWNTPQAHAQTPNDSQGLPTKAVDQAVSEFLNYLRERAAIVDSAVSAGNYAEALFRLGYATHALQDLAAHSGMTNAYHAYESSIDKNPDVEAKHIDLAAKWTAELLDATHARLGVRWDNLKTYEGPRPTADQEAISGFNNLQADRSVAELIRYKFLLQRPLDNPEFARLWGEPSRIESIHDAGLRAISPTWNAKSQPTVPPTLDSINRQYEQENLGIRDAMRKALQRCEHCTDIGSACMSKCSFDSGDGAYLRCMDACGNCDAEFAAFNKLSAALDALEERHLSELQALENKRR